jgi:hypothetical protein
MEYGDLFFGMPAPAPSAFLLNKTLLHVSNLTTKKLVDTRCLATLIGKMMM